MERASQKPIVLQAGQSAQCYLPRCMIVCATYGTLTIHPAPAWLGERMMRSCFHLKEGESWTSPSAGWIVITAKENAEAICFAEKTPSARAWQQLHLLLMAGMNWLRRLRLTAGTGTGS